MQKLRKRRSFSKKVAFSPVETEKNENEEVKQEKKEKPARRLGNYVRYGKTVFELHENKQDSIYCTLLEVIFGKTTVVVSYRCLSKRSVTWCQWRSQPKIWGGQNFIGFSSGAPRIRQKGCPNRWCGSFAPSRRRLRGSGSGAPNRHKFLGFLREKYSF